LRKFGRLEPDEISLPLIKQELRPPETGIYKRYGATSHLLSSASMMVSRATFEGRERQRGEEGSAAMTVIMLCQCKHRACAQAHGIAAVKQHGSKPISGVTGGEFPSRPIRRARPLCAVMR